MLTSAVEIGTNTNIISSFLGYNHNLRSNVGEFFDEKNLTTDFFPILSPREKRVTALQSGLNNITQMFSTEEMGYFYIKENKLFDSTGREIVELNPDYVDEKRSMVRMGTRICIFPDGVIYDGETVTYVGSSFTSDIVPTFKLAKMDGTVYSAGQTYEGTDEPDHDIYPFWLDTSKDATVLKMWDSNSSQWVSVPTTYVKIEATGIGYYFKEGDAVTISGSDLEDFNTSMIIQAIGADYIVVIGIMDHTQYVNDNFMTFERVFPKMNFVCEYNNRLWGCGWDGHEVYASKQGDPTNWYVYEGISSDSYAATVGTEGKWTGCIAHLGYVLFFKENCVHKLYGTTPATFQLSMTELRGVEEASYNSLVVLNERLYYKGRNGIYVYDGTLPQDISDAFADEIYTDAIAIGYEDKYYISMRDTDYNWFMFVFDTKTGIWHKEGKVKILGFAKLQGMLYYVENDGNMKGFPYNRMKVGLFPDMYTEIDGIIIGYPAENVYPDFVAPFTLEDDIEWMAETGDLGLENPYNKYVARVVIRMLLEEGSSFKFEIQYDSDGLWEDLFNLVADSKRTYNIPIRVKRCDHYKLRLSGKGACKIYSLTQSIETGSEL